MFVSYSSGDSDIISRIERDLQLAGVDTWRDVNRIMPGDALRGAIFREGMAECHHAFAYVTLRSMTSSWVRQELDAATTINLERDGTFLSIFVDSIATRDRLTPELRSLSSPVLTDATYEHCVRALISNSWRALMARRKPLQSGYPPPIEQAISEQLLRRDFYKSQVLFDVVIDDVRESVARFRTELSYKVTNRRDTPHHWYIGKTIRFPTPLREVFFNGVAQDVNSPDNRDVRGLRVPCLLEPGETGDVLIRVEEEIRVPDSNIFTSYNPATDLRVQVRYPEALLEIDAERLYFVKVQPHREPGLLDIYFDRGVLPYQGTRLTWRRR